MFFFGSMASISTEGNESFANGGFSLRLMASRSGRVPHGCGGNSRGNTFTLQGDYYEGDENMPTGGNAGVSGGNLLGRWSHTFADDSELSLQTYYDRTHLADPAPGVGAAPAGTLTDDLDTYDLDFQYHFHLGKRNNIVMGLGYRFTHDVDNNAPALAFLPPVLDQNLFSGFAQDEIMLDEKWFLTLGTKLEHNDYTGFEVEPSGRLQWKVTPKQMLWAAVSRAVRTPSRIDRDLREPTDLPPAYPQSVLDGGSDFESETLIAYESGYRALWLRFPKFPPRFPCFTMIITISGV